MHIRSSCILLLIFAGQICAPADDEQAPAVFTVTEEAVAPDPYPFGLNFLVGKKGFNNMSRSSSSGSMEPELFRTHMYINRIEKTNERDGFCTDALERNPNYTDGFFNGAAVRIYRRVGDAPYARVRTDRVLSHQGKRNFTEISIGARIPGRGQDITDRVVRNRNGMHYTDGRICEFYQQTDLRNGQTYYYAVQAVHESGEWSDYSHSVKAVPNAAADTGPRIMSIALDRVKPAKRDVEFKAYRDTLEAAGGAEPMTWEVSRGALPAGLELTTRVINGRSQGEVHGTPVSDEEQWFTVKVTDAEGRSDEKEIGINFPDPPRLSPRDRKRIQQANQRRKNKIERVKPEPPVRVRMEALNGAVTVRWDPSPTPGVIGYVVSRSKYPPAEHASRIVLEGDAGNLQTNDLVFLDMETRYRPPESFHDTKLFTFWLRSPYELGFRKNGETRWTDWKRLDSLYAFDRGSWRRVPHPGTIPPDFDTAGRSCLELKADPGNDLALRLLKHASKEQEFYNVIIPGRTYRFEAWMRQEGIPNGRVTFWDTQMKDLEQAMTVDGTWKKYSCDFSIDDWYDNRSVDSMWISFDNGGTLWVDCAVVYDATDADGDGSPDVPANGFRPEWKQELLNFYNTGNDVNKGVIRFWGAQANRGPGTTLDGFLAPPLMKMDAAGDHSFSLGQFLHLCVEVRAEPWLIISASWEESEWQGLIEYLAGDPKTKYGRQRVADRNGNTTPWTDTFEHIFVENDNETWNGMFYWNFRGREDEPNGRATAYGKFCELMFSSAQKHPAWDQHSLDGKVQFIVNGWTAQSSDTGYGHLAAAAAPSSQWSDVAPYLGGWEARSFLGGTTFTDEGVQQWLLYRPWKHQFSVDEHVATALSAPERGRDPYRMAVYEGGPGYDLPAPGNPSGPVPESYGKSLAAAVTTFDCYMYESYRGYGPQAFFGFRPGTRWSSHVQTFEGRAIRVRPQTAFLALQLRNLYGRGEFVKVGIDSVPTKDMEALSRRYPAMQDMHMAACYAQKMDDRFTIYLLSRRLDDRNEKGEVLDPAITPVTLNLPFKKAKSITLHKLAGDPRQSNVVGLPTCREPNFAIESCAIPASALNQGVFHLTEETGAVRAGERAGLPPGCIYAYVFEGVTP